MKHMILNFLVLIIYMRSLPSFSSGKWITRRPLLYWLISERTLKNNFNSLNSQLFSTCSSSTYQNLHTTSLIPYSLMSNSANSVKSTFQPTDSYLLTSNSVNPAKSTYQSTDLYLTDFCASNFFLLKNEFDAVFLFLSFFCDWILGCFFFFLWLSLTLSSFLLKKQIWHCSFLSWEMGLVPSFSLLWSDFGLPLFLLWLNFDLLFFFCDQVLACFSFLLWSGFRLPLFLLWLGFRLLFFWFCKMSLRRKSYSLSFIYKPQTTIYNLQSTIYNKYI